jgi:hypothetical protein
MRINLIPTRILIGALMMGLGGGFAAGVGAAPVQASVVESAKGHGHIEPDGSLFCHCTGTYCSPCAATEQ